MPSFAEVLLSLLSNELLSDIQSYRDNVIQKQYKTIPLWLEASAKVIENVYATFGARPESGFIF